MLVCFLRLYILYKTLFSCLVAYYFVINLIFLIYFRYFVNLVRPDGLLEMRCISNFSV